MNLAPAPKLSATCHNAPTSSAGRGGTAFLFILRPIPSAINAAGMQPKHGVKADDVVRQVTAGLISPKTDLALTYDRVSGGDTPLAIPVVSFSEVNPASHS